jgi:hypothetical protein
VCSGATPLCSLQSTSPTCLPSCGGSTPDICGTKCVNKMADATPVQEQVPDVAQIEESVAFVEPVPAAGDVLTTTADSATQVPLVTEPVPDGAAEVMPQPEQVMLTRNIQKVALELLDTNTLASTISWQQDGQQYSARIQRQPSAPLTAVVPSGMPGLMSARSTFFI